VPVGGEEAEEGVGAAGDGDGDGEDVVDEQRGAGDDAGGGREELACDEVAAAPVGEERDDLRVAGADRDDGEDGGEGDEDCEGMVRAEGAEGFLGAVAGGGEAVGAEADPGEDGDERDLVEEIAVGERAGAAEEEGL
jgi:hypothetical protein